MPTLLFLCHANIARSPAAELLARTHLGIDRRWDVKSAGTHARSGDPIDTHIGESLQRRGIVSAGHRSAPANAALLAEARLILTFETVQRSWVLRDLPGAVRRTFTIRRAAGVLADHGMAGLDSDSAAYSADDDFADPHGLGPHAADSAVADIERLLEKILPVLASGVRESDASKAPSGRAGVFDPFADSAP